MGKLSAHDILQVKDEMFNNRNEWVNRKVYTNIVENVISRLVNEGIMEMDGEVENDDYNEEEKEYHFIWDNNKIILRVLEELCGNCPHYVTCEIDKYDAYVDFSDLYIIVSMDDDGYIFVSTVEGKVLDGKKLSTELWKEVGECVNKINSFNKKLTDLQYAGRNNAFEY